jgi:hypothetical protein
MYRQIDRIYKARTAKVNVNLKIFSKQLISNPPQEFTDILCNYYTTKIKRMRSSKYHQNSCFESNKIKKRSSATSSDELEKGLNMMLQHLDSTKYYRVKVGFSGRGILFRYVKTTIKKKEWIKRKKQSIICYQSQFRCFY